MSAQPAERSDVAASPPALTTRRLSTRQRLTARLGLLFGGTLAGLLLVELLLTVLGQPRFQKAHSFARQFTFMKFDDHGVPVYVNTPSSSIRFVYDGNPRGYFGRANEVTHTTNALGFRGSDFALTTQDGGVVATKAEDTVRLVFLGDSFTFGEGVRDAHTYPAQTEALLQREYPSGSPRFEAYNLGVGGYNTTQELFLLENFGLMFRPDCIVLGYVLNDAEPPLFERDPATGDRRRVRRPFEEWAGDPRPPDTLLYRLRTARLVWQARASRERSRRTIAHYQALYADDSPGWQESRRALRQIITRCHEAGIPCYVILFPILYELNDAYPFQAIHARIRAEVEGLNATVIDLFPRLKGQRAEALWVHPTDQHPNEQVHRIAAQALAAKLLTRGQWWRLKKKEDTPPPPPAIQAGSG